MDGVALRWEEETEKPLVIFLFLGIFAAVVILWSGKRNSRMQKTLGRGIGKRLSGNG